MRVMVFGTFDDLHPGHRYLLSHASKRGELWIVVARDANVQKFKGHAPLQSEAERMRIIREEFPSSHVVLGDDADYLNPVRTVGPDLILLGYDQKLPPGVSEESFGVPVERLDAFESHIHKSSLRRQMSGT